MRLSVVLITWNAEEKLKRCIDSVLSSIDHAKDEIVLVDNASVDGTEKMVGRDYPMVRYMRLGSNIGVGPARNRGISLARGKYIMTLDDDAWVKQGNVGDVIESIFESHPDLGLVGFRIDNPDGSRQPSTRRFPNALQPFVARLPLIKNVAYFSRLHHHHLMSDFGEPTDGGLVEVDYVLGANQVFLKDAAVYLGGYDEKIFYGPEDMEFCMRIRDLGRTVAYSNLVTMGHEYQRRTTKVNSLLIKHVRGFYHVFRKRRSLWRLK